MTAGADEVTPASPRTLREALDALARSQKTSKGAPAYSRFVNRRLGRVLAAAAFVTGRTPNQVTVVSALLSFTGVAIIATMRPSPLIAALVVILLVVGYALDAADGQLARLRGGGSTAGEWLDHIADAIKLSTIHLAVLVSWYRFGEMSDAQLLVPLGFQAVSSVLFFAMILTDQLRRARRGITRMLLQDDGSSSVLYSLAVVPTDYGVLIVVFGLFWWSSGFFAAYTTLFLLTVGFLALALPKWYREFR